jgi:hypothetical protein
LTLGLLGALNSFGNTLFSIATFIYIWSATHEFSDVAAWSSFVKVDPSTLLFSQTFARNTRQWTLERMGDYLDELFKLAPNVSWLSFPVQKRWKGYSEYCEFSRVCVSHWANQHFCELWHKRVPIKPSTRLHHIVCKIQIK